MSPGSGDRRARLQARDQARVEALAQRWARQRYAVPYDTEGPKVTLGVAWFVAAVAAATAAPLALAVVVAPVAGLAAWQAARAWHHEVSLDERLAAAVAVGAALAGLGGRVGLGVAVVVATLGVAAAAVALSWSSPPTRAAPDRGAARRAPSAWDRRLRLAEVAVRVTVPVGLVGGSLVGLADRGAGIAVALLLVVSAYEAGDFIIGTGSSNAVEGPLAGVVSAVVVAVVVAAVQPSDGGVALGLLAAAVVLAPAGQVVASALLPRGAAWAPALRRLDSYLVSAPLWFVLA